RLHPPGPDRRRGRPVAAGGRAAAGPGRRPGGGPAQGRLLGAAQLAGAVPGRGGGLRRRPRRAAARPGRQGDQGQAGHRRQTPPPPPPPLPRPRRPPRAPGVGVCLDFDGTIAPIVEAPAAARPLPGIVELLGPLADRYAAMALISGRPATYLASHAAAPGVRYLGLYGLEEIVEGRVQVDPRLEAARPAVAAAARDLAGDPAVTASGAHLEDKRHPAAAHTRPAPP